MEDVRIANSWQNQPPQNKTTTNPPWYLGVCSGSLFCLFSTSALNRIMLMISTLSVTPFLPRGGRWIVVDWQERGGREKLLPKTSWSPSRHSFHRSFINFFYSYYPTWHPSQTFYLTSSFSLLSSPSATWNPCWHFPAILCPQISLKPEGSEAMWWHKGHLGASALSPLGQSVLREWALVLTLNKMLPY